MTPHEQAKLILAMREEYLVDNDYDAFVVVWKDSQPGPAASGGLIESLLQVTSIIANRNVRATKIGFATPGWIDHEDATQEQVMVAGWADATGAWVLLDCTKPDAEPFDVTHILAEHDYHALGAPPHVYPILNLAHYVLATKAHYVLATNPGKVTE